MKGNGRDLVLALEGAPIQRLDVRENLIDVDAVHANGAAGQAIEHECVIGIRTVRDSNFHAGSLTGDDG